MPIPKPNAGETQKDYVSRCMEAQGSEDKPQDQKLAICYSNYREAKGQEITKSELFGELMFCKGALVRITEEKAGE